MNLHIIALFKFNENYLMDAVELFQNLVKETRKEEGCLQYDLIEDKDNKGTFFLIELWDVRAEPQLTSQFQPSGLPDHGELGSGRL